MIKNTTNGHRLRLRRRFCINGFDGFQEYELLEYLLTYIIIRKDVKPLAKELILRFGSFSGVMDAPIEELGKIENIGNVTALGIKGFRELMKCYFKSAVSESKIQITKISELVNLLRSQIGHFQNEVFYAIHLNAKNNILRQEILGEGTVSQSIIYPRKLVEQALKLKTTSLIIAHNHPGGIAEPSDADKTITTEIKQALSLVEVSLQEHIILADDKYFSFRRSNLI